MAKSLKIYNGDIVRSYTNNGYVFVNDNEKVRQDVALVLTTDVRPSTGLGCGLDKLIGSDTENTATSFSIFPVASDFQARVRVGLSRLKKAQQDYLFDQRGPKELIYDFSPAQIWQLMEDPRNYGFSVNVLTEDGTANFAVKGKTRT